MARRGRPRATTPADERTGIVGDFAAFCNDQQGRVRRLLRPAQIRSHQNATQLKRELAITRKGLDVGGKGIPW